ncbi:hypothetical protein BDV93DRAFT_563975 [Ceratobasidium sp. AG-I]|nr:hypothetical protein BDV93DRAFT_563975 [Ceratobasidium sp. AG-I]
MGEAAIVGYFYKGRFYQIRVYKNEEGPTEIGQVFAKQIPDNLEERATWIEKKKLRLDSMDPYDGVGQDVNGTYALTSEINCLIPSSGYLTWSYLIDLDNNVFTINGTIHFSLYTIPLQTWPKYLDYHRSYGNCHGGYPRRSVLRPDTPAEYIGSVSRWAEPELDYAKVAQDYASLAALQTSPAEWGVPGWDTLSVSQNLSAKLVQTVLFDYPDIFSNPDVAGARRFVNLCCWQLVSAAAPSLLHCPPMSTAQLKESDVLRSNDGFRPVIPKSHSLRANLDLWTYRGIEEYLAEARAGKTNTWDHIYWTLRGCLITFCPRLDTPDFVKLEVKLAIDALKRSPSRKSVAIICSGKRVVAASFHGGIVHHTPALLIHNKTLAIQSGTLENLVKPHAAAALRSAIFPADILREIIHFSDYETYQQLSMACQYARSVYFSHPRINESILIRTIDGGFVVRDRTTGHEHSAHMRRTGWGMHKQFESTFHIRQVGFAAADQIDGSARLNLRERIYMHFTPSRKQEKLDHAMSLRILTIWGRWVMEEGVTCDEDAVAVPNRLGSRWFFYLDDFNQDDEDDVGWELDDI